ncbi:LexA family transcriptional regulator [Burkholderia vietnamiensis]|uniref:LexA family transcriptional regulator n=1 Tax=Burkholderia vietnamiensis TaxID=60552 RepID=UPI001B8F9659|nr:LexA family transcriptional regulator [Burkholderia vietnamiensis]MBR8055648.1 LexA family transcriptional regulator [Burkholderia vietnamiensis]
MNETKARIQGIIDRMKDVVGAKADVDLAEAIGASRSQVAVWKIRDRMPLAECVALAEKRGVSLDWLVLGRGQEGVGGHELPAQASELDEVQDDGYIDIPAYDLAGFIELTGAPQISARVPRAWLDRYGAVLDEVIAFQNAGNVMSPTINDGDVVIVDRRVRDVDGVYVVRVGDSLRLRRVQRTHAGALHLLTDNATYANETIGADEVDAVEFIGFCFAHLRCVR